MRTHVIVIEVVVAVLGFTFAAGPALAATLMDLREERAIKEAAQAASETARELEHV